MEAYIQTISVSSFLSNNSASSIPNTKTYTTKQMILQVKGDITGFLNCTEDLTGNELAVYLRGT